jgi:phthiocerol/phenolphthiocerol synthesis type-I polyketide synthase E
MVTQDYQSESVVAEPATGTAAIAATGNETARQLARIWQEILGVGPIGFDQNYFDLGGDSSLAVRMFAQIEKVFQVKLPLATLYDAPTIEELARILRGEAEASGWSPLVAIQPTGSRPPLFCMHPHGGNVLIYRDLSRHLGSDQPFYGLQCRGLDGTQPPLTQIEDMAALYLKDIQKLQPHGPYLLGGYCMGGTIAFEVAQQLQAKGEPVALLALFDTMYWSQAQLPSIWEKAYYNCQRLAFHAADFLSLDSAAKGRFFREKVNGLRSRIPVWRSMLLAKLRRSPAATASESWVLGQIWQTNERACLSYVPQPYPGTIVDFRPLKQYRSFDKPELKWDRLAKGGQEVVVLPVNPPNMLVEPFVRHLAIALRKYIDDAIRSCESR